MALNKEETRRKIVGIFQQSARGDISIATEHDDETGKDTFVFYQSETREIFLKLDEDQFEKYSANEILDMLGATL